jgi:xanthine/uracil/vitamin C permease (AzgA family)
MRDRVERVFRLREHGTTVRTELLGGATTFSTMAYIIVVNPAIRVSIDQGGCRTLARPECRPPDLGRDLSRVLRIRPPALVLPTLARANEENLDTFLACARRGLNLT